MRVKMIRTTTLWQCQIIKLAKCSKRLHITHFIADESGRLRTARKFKLSTFKRFTHIGEALPQQSVMHDQRLSEFMKHFILSDSQLQELHKRFCNEIQKGLAKDTHDAADVKCYVTYVHDVPTGRELGKYLALDLGGTNFRVLLVTLQGHHDAIFQSKIYAVPQELMLGHGDKLFDHIAACLADFVDEHQVGDQHLPLGFTFSFPCTQLGLTKALLVRWTKGFQCAGVEGEDVCRLLKEAIARRGNLTIDVMAILNDTTGTLMSCAHRNPECRIGVIVGTGCNACYMENVDNVDLLEPELKTENKHVIINTEWGAFGDSGNIDFIRTVYDKEIDRCSINVGSQIFEKMISGMYLGDIVRLVIIKATEANLLFAMHAAKARAKLATFQFETKHMSDVEEDNFPEFKNTKAIIKEIFEIEKPALEDCQKLRFICECVAKRAAQLVAVGISGLINRIEEPKVVVGIDGSVYRKHPKFDDYMCETMKKLVNKRKSFEVMLSEDGSGRGAALVAAVADHRKFD